MRYAPEAYRVLTAASRNWASKLTNNQLFPDGSRHIHTMQCALGLPTSSTPSKWPLGCRGMHTLVCHDDFFSLLLGSTLLLSKTLTFTDAYFSLVSRAAHKLVFFLFSSQHGTSSQPHDGVLVFRSCGILTYSMIANAADSFGCLMGSISTWSFRQLKYHWIGTSGAFSVL